MSEKDEWGEIVYYLDGKGYGIAENLQTVCLGTEIKVKEMLANPIIRTGNAVIDEILNLELKLREGEGYATADIRKGITNKRHSVTERSRPVRSTKLEGRHTRLVKTGKRLPIH